MSRTPNDALSRVEPPRVIQNKPPLFKGTDLVKSANLVDMLAGRLMPSKMYTDSASVLTAWHIVLPASPKRVAIVFFPPLTQTVTLSTENPPSPVAGINLQVAVGPIYLNAKQHGDIVTREWYAISSTGSAVLSWIEVYGPDNVCLEDQMRQGTNW